MEKGREKKGSKEEVLLEDRDGGDHPSRSSAL